MPKGGIGMGVKWDEVYARDMSIFRSTGLALTPNIPKITWFFSWQVLKFFLTPLNSWAKDNASNAKNSQCFPGRNSGKKDGWPHRRSPNSVFIILIQEQQIHMVGRYSVSLPLLLNLSSHRALISILVSSSTKNRLWVWRGKGGIAACIGGLYVYGWVAEMGGNKDDGWEQSSFSKSVTPGLCVWPTHGVV